MESGIHHNLPLSIQTEDPLGWTALWILLLSATFVYGVSAVGGPSPTRHPSTRSPPRAYLAEAKHRKAIRAAQIKLENRRVRIREDWSQNGFPFRKLMPELQLAVLAYSSEWISTYRSLLLVSRYMYHSTLRACIPYMPITLSTTRQLSSFLSLTQREPRPSGIGCSPLRVGALVHQLWVTPLKREDNVLGYAILKACTNIRVLACEARTLEMVTSSPRLRHTLCRNLTLLLTRPNWELKLMNRPTGPAFLRQLTHLRVMGEQTIPREPGFSGLTHLSYPERPPFEDSDPQRPWALDAQTVFPSLQKVVLTRRGDPNKCPARKINSRLVLLYVVRDFTEIEMWCNIAKGRSMWYEAERTLLEIKPGFRT